MSTIVENVEGFKSSSESEEELELPEFDNRPELSDFVCPNVQDPITLKSHFGKVVQVSVIQGKIYLLIQVILYHITVC